MKRLTFLLVWVPLLAARTISDRYIVELSGEPVAVHMSRQARRPAMGSLAAREYRAQIRGEQRQGRARMEQEEATILDGVDTVANALIVHIPDAKASRLARLAGVVRVRPVREFKLLLDHALPVQKVPEAWAQIGAERAGAGMKIGIIDTGIDAGHLGFQDPSLTAPDGFPKVNSDQDLEFTNPKVIVARSYASLFSRRETDPTARDRVGHGTALAMAAAGVLNAGPLASISGVAPRAYLGSYKVFGTPGVNDGASEDAILKAIDDAVADGMDVINLSLGSDVAPRLEDDLLVTAIERAAAAGVLVVVAAGNNGPDPNTIGSPATAPSAIAVGASRNDRIFSSMATIEGAAPYVAFPGSGPAPSDAITASLADVGSLDPSGLACTSLAADSLTGRIALVLRGTCTFEEKLNNVQGAGAVAALVYANQDQPDPIGMYVGAATLPAEMVSYQNGLEIKQRLTDQPLIQATLRFTLAPVGVSSDRLAAFSPEGPSVDGTIKPELVAVGTSVYTATQKFDTRGEMYDPSGYIAVDGTSFSAPLAAGAAALLKSARPGLTTAQYKSLLIQSATRISFQTGSVARVQQAGGGLLDVSAGLRAGAAVSPAAVSFGSGGPDPKLSRKVTLTNLGGAAQSFSISVAARDGAPGPVASASTIQLDPGASVEIGVDFSATSLQPGSYEGFLTIQGTSSDVETRIPYWYAVTSDVPQYVTILDSTAQGRRGSSLTAAIIFRVTEASGVALNGVTPTVTAVSGGGSVTSVVSYDDLVPGAYAVRVRLGFQAGLNVFRIQAGDVQKEISIVGR